MSTEQLLDLIHAEFESSEHEDDALTERILEVIEEREKSHPSGLLPDVNQAWENFRSHYLPDSEDCPFYPMKDSGLTAFEEARPSKPRRGRLLKKLIPVAAVVAVTFSSMVAAQAFGFDIFGALARWTSETFRFAAETSADSGSPESRTFQETLQDAFDICGISIPAPAWYPEGTALVGDIDIIEAAESSAVTCEFTLEGEEFYIMVQQYYNDDRIPVYTFEKDGLDVEEYTSNGRLFYIVSNLSQGYAAYSSGQTVMLINGNLSAEIIKQIIDSIGA